MDFQNKVVFVIDKEYIDKIAGYCLNNNIEIQQIANSNEACNLANFYEDQEDWRSSDWQDSNC